MSRLYAMGVVLACAGCPSPLDGGERLMDTGWFTDTGSGPVSSCTARVVDTLPVADAVDWYWRDAPHVWVEETSSVYEVRLIDEVGRITQTTLDWSDDALSFHARFDGGLAPLTRYTLEITDCGTVHEIPFETGALGRPVDGGVTSLVGKTYQIGLGEAEWVEPGGFGPLLSLYFDDPILLGVEWVDDTRIDFVGAQGYIDSFGEIGQASGPLWDFPMSEFADRPYFENRAELVTLEVLGAALPITDFVLDGTFDASGTFFGGGVLSGNGDTRDMGALAGSPGEEAAICDLAATLGVMCDPCSDGQPYCLYVELHDVVGSLVDGLTLVRDD